MSSAKWASLSSWVLLFLAMQVFWAVTVPPVLAQDTSKSPLVVMGDKDYPPYESLVDGKPSGINVDLWREITKILGRPLDLRLYQWADAQARVRRGEAKVLTFIGIDMERAKLYDFTQPTFTSRFSIFVLAGIFDQFDISDLTGKRIAVKKGGFPRTIIETIHPEAEMVFVDSALEGFRKLLRGEVDGVTEEERVGYTVLSENDIGGIRATPKALGVKTGHIAVVKGNPALLRQIDEALGAVKTSGKFDQIVDKWAGAGTIVFTRKTITFIAVSGLVFILLLFSLGGAIYVLKVRKNNRALKEEVLERKRAEDALAESEERYRTLIESASVIAWEVELKSWRFTYVSPHAVVLLGYELDEWYAEDFWADHIHPDDREQSIKFCKDATERGEDHDFEYRMIAADGRSVWLRDIVTVITEGGLPVSMRGFMIDITERKGAEDALAESEARLRRSVLDAPIPIIMHAEDGEILMLSNKWIELSGYSHSDIPTIHDWMEKAYGADKKHLERQFEVVNTLYDIKESGQHEACITTASGEKRTWEVRDAPLGRLPDGRRFVISMAVDVTERKEIEEALRKSEALFRAVVDHSPNKIHIKDVEGRYTLINKEAEKLFGVTDEEGRGKTAYDLFDKDVADSFTAHDQAVKALGKAMEEEEEFILDDGVHTFLTTKFPIFETDEITGVGAIGTDITKRKKVEILNTRFGRIIEQSLNEIYIFDDQTLHFIQVNHGARDNLGYTMEELQELTPLDLKPEFTQQTFKKLIKPLRNGTEEIITFETVHLRKDGSTYDVEVHLQLMMSETPAVFVAIIQDITERKKVETALRQGEERLRGAVDSLEEGFILFDADDHLITFNDEYRRISPSVQEIMERGGTFEDLLRDNVEYGAIVEAIGREEEFIKERIEQHRHPKGPIIRRFTDGKTYMMKEVPTPEGGIALSLIDITDLKRTEEALRQGETRFKDFAETTSDFFWEMDANMRFSFFSDHFEKITGVTQATLLGKTREETSIPNVDPDAWAKHLADLKAHRRFDNFLHPRTHLNGQVVWLSISGKPVFDENGVFQGYRGTGTDITERKQVELALRQGEAQLRAIIESTPGAIVIRNLEGRNLIVNQMFCDWHAVDKDEIIGKTMFDYLPPQIFDEISAHEREVIETKKTVESQRRVTFQDGVTRDVFSQKFPIFSSYGDCVAIGTIGTDITERKQVEEALRESEERLRNVINNSPMFISLQDKDGRFKLVNQGHTALHGFKQSDIVGKRISEVLHKKVAKDSATQRRKVIETKAVVVEERPIITNKGTFDFLVTKFPILDESGAVTEIGTVGVDISSRNQAEEALRETEKQLRQSQKMEAVGQLTGGVAHDFNNLLAIISCNLELVVDSGGLGDEIREMLDRAMVAVDKGANLTDQLLAFSRQQALEPKTIEVNSLLFDTINLLQRTLGEDIDIKTAFDSHIQFIRVDPGMLENAILNMANNARDAMSKGGTLTIKTASVELDGEVLSDNQNPQTGPHVLISISDTGMGIKKRDLVHVFEPFYTTKDVGEGTGLGLSMVFGFVKQSGGHVTIDSKRGKGTTVNLYLPAAGSLDAETMEKATSPEAEAMGAETILVVEDDEDVRKVTTDMLSRLGYNVLEAENGPSAINILGKDGNGVDMVFSDVVMPSGISGYDLANELRRHYKDIKVLMTSGYPEKIIDKDGIDATGITLLRKPYKKTQLMEAVRTAFEQ